MSLSERIHYRLNVLSPAKADAAAAALWYERQARGLGRALLFELDQQFRRIRLFPWNYPALTATSRRCILQRFPYMVIYRVKEELVEIVAIMHASVDPALVAARE